MSFDRLAPHYRWMEAVLAGGKLQRCRLAFLDQVQEARSILLLGEGPGRFLTEMLRANCRGKITCVDASSGMLCQAERRAWKSGIDASRVAWVHADVLEWTPPDSVFDLIVTHFFLDCFRPDQLAAIVRRVGAMASETATWLLADFREPPTGVLRWRARLIIRLMYAFFRVATSLPGSRLTEPDGLLLDQGFVLADRRVAEWGLLHSDLWVREGLRASPFAAKLNAVTHRKQDGFDARISGQLAIHRIDGARVS